MPHIVDPYKKHKKQKKKTGTGSTVKVDSEGTRTVVITDPDNIDPAYLKKNREYAEKQKKKKQGR